MMTTLPRRQKAEKRRGQILDAALTVFANKGFAGASMRDIAREVGVTEGLLYHYFPSKDELLTSCFEERGWTAQLGRIVAEAEGKPLEVVLRDMVSSFLETLYTNRETMRVFCSESHHDEKIANFHKRKVESNLAMLGEFVDARQKSGDIQPGVDAGSVGSLLLGSAYAMFTLYGMDEPDVWAKRASEYVDSTVSAVMWGLVPR
jgi:AcrR family transcriptional regulator